MGKIVGVSRGGMILSLGKPKVSVVEGHDTGLPSGGSRFKSQCWQAGASPSEGGDLYDEMCDVQVWTRSVARAGLGLA